LTRSPCPLGS